MSNEVAMYGCTQAEVDQDLAHAKRMGYTNATYVGSVSLRRAGYCAW